MKYFGIAAIAVAWATPLTAQSELATLNGEWQGRGTDRDSLLAAPQPTTCRSSIRADQAQLSSDSECTGDGGLHKVNHLTFALVGNDITGQFEQIIDVVGAQDTTRVLKGTVSGLRQGDTATFNIVFPGIVPRAIVTFKLISPLSYSLHATSLGVTITDVTYNKTGGR